MPFSLSLPPQAETALRRLNAAGFEAYIVGGCVRDAMRGAVPHDWDCTTSALPAEIAACFPDYHVIETGIQHGTVTVVIDGMPVEITTFRIDGVYADHRRPEQVTFTASLTEDLARRDFTVNAMAYHPQKGLQDPFHGAEDLQDGILRCVGNPDDRFEEDGLRILRAMRFSSMLDFPIDTATADAIHRKKTLLRHISAERIFAEMQKLLCGAGCERVLTEYSDVLFLILPELEPMFRFAQNNPHHDYDVYTHTLKVIAACPQEPVLRWAALFHDAGKPHCYTEDARGGHFYGHAKISVPIAQRALHLLKSDRHTLDTVLKLIKLHDMVWEPNDKLLRRAVSRYGYDFSVMLLQLHRADVSAQAEQHRAERTAEADRILQMLDALKQADACMSLKHLAVKGSDLREIGMPEGKIIGECLHFLLEQVIEGTLPNEKAELLQAAKKKFG